jgi:hypothetical protein
MSATESSGAFEIRSEPRGPHWIAWIVRTRSDKPEKPDTPDRGIVLVGRTKEDAEARARAFAENPLY